MNLTASAMDAIQQSAHFKVFDYFVLIALLLVSLVIGIYFGYFDKSEKTLEEYLLGGRRMQSIPIAISLVAR